MQKFLPAFAAAMLATAAHAQTTPAPTTKMPEKSPSATAPSTTTTPSTTPSVTTKSGTDLMLTDGEAKAWVDKKVVSSDGKNLGEVVAFTRDANGHVTELHADIGGFLGIGESRVRLTPSQFKLEKDQVVVNMTAEQAKTLPKVAK